MAEKGSRDPASDVTAEENLQELMKEMPQMTPRARHLSGQLRQQLREAGLKGFKRGGKVQKTGVAKVHKGERVITVKQAKKPAVKAALRRTK